MKSFVYDVPVNQDNICNLKQDKIKLNQAVKQGERVVLYGRRNTGKTSLLLNEVMPTFQRSHPEGLAIYADLMGVKTVPDISRRLRKAYEHAAKSSAPVLSAVQQVANLIKGIRPIVSFDAFGNPELSLKIESESEADELDTLFQYFAKVFESRPLLIIIDEFQDVALVDQAEALLRGAFQKLPAHFPVVLSGSKKHLMSAIFGRPKAPLSGWGYDLQISSITAEDYFPYIQERLEPFGIEMSLETTKSLLEQVSDIPEAANIVCSSLSKHLPSGVVTEKQINDALDVVASERRGRYEEQLVHYSHEEQILLIAIARFQPIKSPQSKHFLNKVPELSGSGIRKLIHRFENEALIYREDEGFVLADPIMRRYILLFH